MNIGFVYPAFLSALLLISIPIIIHLFNFRRFRTVMFTNVRFLKELKEETTSRSRLKHMLVLASRILAVAFLVLAFAQPYIPSAQGQKMAASRAVSVFIDNSFSMESVTREGTLLDVAVKKARDIAMAYKPGDRFHLLTNDFDPGGQRMLTREEFLSSLDRVRVSPYSRRLSEITSRQRDVLVQSQAAEQRQIVISDFQSGMADFGSVKSDSLISVSLVPIISSKVSNTSIDTCWFTSPVIQAGQPAVLQVRIRNHGNMDAVGVPLKLVLNGSQRSVAVADVTPGGYTDVKMTFTVNETGWQQGMISITDNPIVFDDKYYFSFPVADRSDLLAIYDDRPDAYLRALFPDSSFFRMQFMDSRQIDYSVFPSRSCIYLSELSNLSSGLTAEISRYINSGGTVVLIPDSAADASSYQAFAAQLKLPGFGELRINQERVVSLSMEDPVFESVFSGTPGLNESIDMPEVTAYFSENRVSGIAGDPLMVLRSGSPLLTRFQKGKGTVYVFYVPWSTSMSNLARHAIFVPVVYRIALLSMKPGKLSYEIGRDEYLELGASSVSGDQVFHLTNKEAGFDMIPGHRNVPSGIRIGIGNLVSVAGNYELTREDQLVTAPAFNFNRSESVMEFYESDALKTEAGRSGLTRVEVLDPGLTELKQHVMSLNEGTRLWKYCIMFVLLFLAVETLLLKYWKP